MDIKRLIKELGFTTKDGAVDIFIKKYPHNYAIEIDFSKSLINYGDKIKSETKTTQNFSQSENFVVLECVNRLLEKGYKPENITLEKVWRTGHGTSGRLDILVTRDNGSAFMMIECKNLGTEFNKEFKNIEKNGGQLFTYFQQDRGAEILMLYSSGLDSKGKLHFENQIIKIEDDYRFTTNVKDFYERWNKIPKNNGVFNEEATPYNYQNKKFLVENLENISVQDSQKLFFDFLKILRSYSISDKPNAFNKIFNLFICKIYDEWFNDNNGFSEFYYEYGEEAEKFILRIYSLYVKAMLEFFNKKIASFEKLDSYSDSLGIKNIDELKKILIVENKDFAIIDIIDKEDFYKNAEIVSKIVKLLEQFKFRYDRKNNALSDFFERLLTTGLKQEVGQYFTPIPIVKFILRSIPIDTQTNKSLIKGEMPKIIDYAAGSGHFLHESMHILQDIIEKYNIEKNLSRSAQENIKSWKSTKFMWAEKYIYGVEKDYRLAKVAKVGCYMHGDGVANVINGDGLDDFYTSKDYLQDLKIDNSRDDAINKDNPVFNFVVSNPPYSVDDFKWSLKKFENIFGKKEHIFDLYNSLTDNSNSIECLFIERTKQLLKDGGVAGIILPSSILSNTGIYTKAREIILKYFEIIGITELGSNTFMATGTNTVTLFLRRRSNYDSQNFEISVNKFFTDFQDVAVNQEEKPFSKYVNYVWEGCSLADYKTLLQKNPNEKILQSELYKDYRKKLKSKNEDEFWSQVLEIEKEKIFYFILAYPQRTVLVKSGEKDAEKRFLGYEFSNRRGSEGIHPIQRGKTIEECTQLFDETSFENPEKASHYIYRAFNGDFDSEIDEKLQNNVSRANLVDMLTFDRVEFEKTISTNAKKKVKIESKWESVKISEIVKTLESGKRPKGGVSEYQDGIPNLGGEHIGLDGKISISNMKFVPVDFFENSNQGKLENFDILICKDGALTGKTALFNLKNFPFERGMINEHVFLLRTNELAIQRYLFNTLFSIKGQELLRANVTGTAQGGLNRENLLNIQIPLPPKDIQQKIVDEIEVLEEKERKAKENISILTDKRKEIVLNISGVMTSLSNITSKIGSGATPSGGERAYKSSGISLIRSQNVYDNHFFEKGLAFIDDEQGEKLQNVTVEKDDILFNITGASIARCCIVPEKYLPARVNQHVSIIRVIKDVLPKYVQSILVSEKYKNELLDIGDGATSRQAITKQQLEDFKIPLPPLSEQEKIVSEIEKIESQIETLEKELADIPKQKEEILRKYL